MCTLQNGLDRSGSNLLQNKPPRTYRQPARSSANTIHKSIQCIAGILHNTPRVVQRPLCTSVQALSLHRWIGSVSRPKQQQQQHQLLHHIPICKQWAVWGAQSLPLALLHWHVLVNHVHRWLGRPASLAAHFLQVLDETCCCRCCTIACGAYTSMSFRRVVVSGTIISEHNTCCFPLRHTTGVCTTHTSSIQQPLPPYASSS